jgi:hypothetical protein
VFPWDIARSLKYQPGAYFLIDLFFLGLLLRSFWVVGRDWLMRMKGKDEIIFPTGAGSELLLFYLALPPVILLILSFFRSQIYVERSMIFLLPAYLILLACGALSFTRLIWRAISLGILLLLFGVSLYCLWGPKAQSWTVWMPKSDWRATTSYFDEEITQNKEKFLIFQVNPETSLVYYYDRLRRGKSHEAQNSYPKELPIVYLKKYTTDEINSSLSRDKIHTCYFILNQMWSGNFVRVLNNVKKDVTFRLVDVARFNGVTVYKFSRT